MRINAQALGALLWLAFAAFLIWAGHDLGIGQLSEPGGGFLIFWGGVLIALAYRWVPRASTSRWVRLVWLPLLVAGLGGLVLAQWPSRLTLAAGAVGLVGVALLVLGAGVTFDTWGVAAALGGTFSMAVGTVLTRLWGSPVPLFLFTGWQLAAGGLLLGALSLLLEGPPRRCHRATSSVTVTWV